ncbi:MAG: substrate-binding domain-containing protein, partial [Acidimicrobiales bacterium]
LVPGFMKSTGDKVNGPPGAGSRDLAEEILSGEIDPGVFLSIGPAPIKKLFRTRRASFAMSLATDPLVVAYSPNSPKAPLLNAIARQRAPLSSLFSLLGSPGFTLARTDPNADPQGAFFELMMHLAERTLKLPAGTADRILGTHPGDSVGATSQVFAETALPSLIASGSVDAGSAYLSQALQYDLSYIRLPSSLDFSDPAQLATYRSVAIKLSNGAVVRGGLVSLDATLVSPPGGSAASTATASAGREPGDDDADRSFLGWLLSGSARRDLGLHGYELERPRLELAKGRSASGVLPSEVLAAFDKLHGTSAVS